MTNQVGEYRGKQEMARIQTALGGEQFIARLAETAVKGIDPKHIASVALNVIRTSEKLQRCDPMSIMGALCQAASVGLLPGNGLGHAWLIPRGGQCNYQIGYQGWRELAMRSGAVSSITSRCVYQGDEFKFSWGIAPTIEHAPGPAHGVDPSLIEYVYAVAIMKDGVPVVEVMPRAEIDRIRLRAQGRSGSWQTDYAEMARKTVIIRLCKSLPRSPEMGRAIEQDAEAYIETTAALASPPSEGGEIPITPEAPSDPSRTLPPPPPPASTPAGNLNTMQPQCPVCLSALPGEGYPCQQCAVDERNRQQAGQQQTPDQPPLQDPPEDLFGLDDIGGLG